MEKSEGYKILNDLLHTFNQDTDTVPIINGMTKSKERSLSSVNKGISFIISIK